MLCCVCGVLGQVAPGHRCACLVPCVACAVSWATWLLFISVPTRYVVLRPRCPEPFGCCSPVCPLAVLCPFCGVLGHSAPVHLVPAWFVVLRLRCPGPLNSCSLVRPLRALLCWCGVLGQFAPAHLVPALFVVLRLRCPGPLGSCSPVRPIGALLCWCCVPGPFAPVHQCARWVPCASCAVSWATWLLFTAVPARCVVSRVRCPGPPGFCSPVRPPGALLCWCGVLGHLAPVHRCARSLCCVVCAVTWATWLLFTAVRAPFLAMVVRCPGPLSSCSPVCWLCVLCCVCSVLGHLAPDHRCARLGRCASRAVPRATWLLFTGVPARCLVSHVRCPWPLGSCSPVRPLGALLCLYGVLRSLSSCSLVYPLGALCCFSGVLGHLAAVHQCARAVCCVVCAVSLAPLLLFTVAPALCIALLVRCPGPLGSCSSVCPLGVLWCMCGVLGHWAPVERCACLVCCVACALSWDTSIMFTSVPAWCVVLCVRCPWPLGSCSPVCMIGLLCCFSGVLGHLAAVHQCARAVCCVVCAVSLAPLLLFTVAPALCIALLVRCPGPLGSCSSVCPLGVLWCMCGVLGHWAPVERCACLVCCVACALSWDTWIMFTSVPAWCVVLCVRCPWPLGSCSPVCMIGLLCCFSGVLGHLAAVHWCARPMCCVACAVSQSTWLVFTDVHAQCVLLRVRCPGQLGSCSPVCPREVLCRLCGALGDPAPDHQCARSACCVACAVSWAKWLLVTGVHAWFLVLLVRCRGPLGSCLSVCPLGMLCCVRGALSHLAAVHRCARSLCCVPFAVSWATRLLFT